MFISAQNSHTCLFAISRQTCLNQIPFNNIFHQQHTYIKISRSYPRNLDKGFSIVLSLYLNVSLSRDRKSISIMYIPYLSYFRYADAYYLRVIYSFIQMFLIFLLLALELFLIITYNTTSQQLCWPRSREYKISCLFALSNHRVLVYANNSSLRNLEFSFLYTAILG